MCEVSLTDTVGEETVQKWLVTGLSSDLLRGLCCYFGISHGCNLREQQTDGSHLCMSAHAQAYAHMRAHTRTHWATHAPINLRESDMLMSCQSIWLIFWRYECIWCIIYTNYDRLNISYQRNYFLIFYDHNYDHIPKGNYTISILAAKSGGFFLNKKRLKYTKITVAKIFKSFHFWGYKYEHIVQARWIVKKL